MANTRPYLLVYKGNRHIIEAAGAAAAVHHVVGEDVSELRAARAAEVTAWIREGNDIPIAGAKPVPAAPEEAPADAAPWEPSEEQRSNVSSWLIGNMRESKSKSNTDNDLADLTTAIGLMFAERGLTLSSFDEIRALCPAFGEAIRSVVESGGQPEDGPTAIEVTIDDVRSSLETLPFPLEIVMGAIPEPVAE